VNTKTSDSDFLSIILSHSLYRVRLSAILKYCCDSGKESREDKPEVQYHLKEVYLMLDPFACSAFGFFAYKIALSSVISKI
jgi:hypothetical protein